MDKHSIDKWYSIGFSNVCWKINEDINGLKFSANKKRNSRHVDKLPFENPLSANVFDDGPIPTAAMDITLIRFNPIHANVNPNKFNHTHLNACKP